MAGQIASSRTPRNDGVINPADNNVWHGAASSCVGAAREPPSCAFEPRKGGSRAAPTSDNVVRRVNNQRFPESGGCLEVFRMLSASRRAGGSLAIPSLEHAQNALVLFDVAAIFIVVSRNGYGNDACAYFPFQRQGQVTFLPWGISPGRLSSSSLTRILFMTL